MQNLSVIQLRILGREEDEAWGNLAGLTHSSQLGLFAKFLHLLSRSRGRLKRRVNWAGRDGVDANSFGEQALGQSASEGDDGALGGSVVDHRRCTAEGNC